MQISTFTTYSIFRLACCSILVSLQRIEWSSVLACSAIANLIVKPLMHASITRLRHAADEKKQAKCKRRKVSMLEALLSRSRKACT